MHGGQRPADRLASAYRASYERLLLEARTLLDPAAYQTFESKLPFLVTNQKRVDAEALLRRVGNDVSMGRSGAIPSFHFSYTEAWHELRRAVDSGRKPSRGA